MRLCAAAEAAAAWREPAPAGRTSNALSVIMRAPPFRVGMRKVRFEAKCYQLDAASDFLTRAYGGLLGPASNQVEHVRAELLELAGADARDRDQRGIVGG